jgi:WhiB family redox-sensing transcriptional regulator
MRWTLPDLPGAACAGSDPEAWFPEVGEPGSTARAICRSCPERDPCLAFALTHRIRFGIWGGQSMTRPNSRKRPRTGQAQPAAAGRADDELALADEVTAAADPAGPPGLADTG